MIIVETYLIAGRNIDTKIDIAYLWTCVSYFAFMPLY